MGVGSCFWLFLFACLLSGELNQLHATQVRLKLSRSLSIYGVSFLPQRATAAAANKYFFLDS